MSELERNKKDKENHDRVLNTIPIVMDVRNNAEINCITQSPITYRKSRLMKIILKYSVKITKQSVLRCVITTITEIKTSYKCSYLAIITMCLCVHENTFLMVGKEGSNNLHKPIKCKLDSQVDQLSGKQNLT